MWRRWLFLSGIIFVVHLVVPLRALAEYTHPGSRSLQGPDPGVGQHDTTHSKEDATAMLLPGTGENDASRIRRRRSETSDIGETMPSLALVPLNLFRNFLAIPRSIVEDIMNWVAEMIGNISETVIAQTWELAKNFIIPKLDRICMQIATLKGLPESIKNMISSAHSTYEFMKLFGYMKPVR